MKWMQHVQLVTPEKEFKGRKTKCSQIIQLKASIGIESVIAFQRYIVLWDYDATHENVTEFHCFPVMHRFMGLPCNMIEICIITENTPHTEG